MPKLYFNMLVLLPIIPYYIGSKGEMLMYQNPFFQANPPLQPQQVLQVNGKTSVEQLKLAPNSSLLAMDTTAPIVWLCKTDSIGAIQAIAYDITPHVEKPPVDVNALEERLIAIESLLMEKKNGKSNATISKPKGEQPGGND